jgi:hypothetical protein
MFANGNLKQKLAVRQAFALDGISSSYAEWKVVAKDGIEPPTQGFSILCSTN